MEENKKSEADALFEQMKEIVPRREVTDLDNPEGVEPTELEGTSSERMEQSPNLTDVQSALLVLLPKLKGYLNVLQVSRIFPDTFNALLELLTIDLIETYPDMGVTEAMMTANTALTIAIDGEGRIDVIALYGKAAETESAKTDKVGLF